MCFHPRVVRVRSMTGVKKAPEARRSHVPSSDSPCVKSQSLDADNDANVPSPVACSERSTAAAPSRIVAHRTGEHARGSHTHSVSSCVQAITHGPHAANRPLPDAVPRGVPSRRCATVVAAGVRAGAGGERTSHHSTRASTCAM